MDILIEIFLEIYFELMLLIVPEKNVTKRHVWTVKIVAIIVLLGLCALIFWGIILIADYGNMLGVIPIAFAGVFSVVQITLGIILYKKHH